jgi:hypothetical protein
MSETLYDWSKIDKSLNWAATDKAGECCAFSSKPELDTKNGGWLAKDWVGYVPQGPSRSVPWQDSLEERPKPNYAAGIKLDPRHEPKAAFGPVTQMIGEELRGMLKEGTLPTAKELWPSKKGGYPNYASSAAFNLNQDEFAQGVTVASDGPLAADAGIPRPQHDPVNRPKHYASHPSGVECIQITEHMNFCLGNAVKYIWRAGEKGDKVEDLKKAIWYINREIERCAKVG